MQEIGGQDTRVSSCNWMGTLNNPEINGHDTLEAIHIMAKAKYTCGQMERGEEGTPHLQFYVSVGTGKQRLSFMKKLSPRAHWEVVKVNAASILYVMKEDTRIEGPWEFGEKPKVNTNKASLQEA